MTSPACRAEAEDGCCFVARPLGAAILPSHRVRRPRPGRRRRHAAVAIDIGIAFRVPREPSGCHVHRVVRCGARAILHRHLRFVHLYIVPTDCTRPPAVLSADISRPRRGRARRGPAFDHKSPPRSSASAVLRSFDGLHRDHGPRVTSQTGTFSEMSPYRWSPAKEMPSGYALQRNSLTECCLGFVFHSPVRRRMQNQLDAEDGIARPFRAGSAIAS